MLLLTFFFMIYITVCSADTDLSDKHDYFYVTETYFFAIKYVLK